ncbi:hypothetical protein KCU85_g350, partial [Aureobasidium melanogenum]
MLSTRSKSSAASLALLTTACLSFRVETSVVGKDGGQLSQSLGKAVDSDGLLASDVLSGLVNGLGHDHLGTTTTKSVAPRRTTVQALPAATPEKRMRVSSPMITSSIKSHNKSKTLDTIKVGVLNAADAGIAEQLLGPVNVCIFETLGLVDTELLVENET